ncbi:MAG: cobyrinate a,c-diamide synthase, partial [Acidimicrobiales bacterium]
APARTTPAVRLPAPGPAVRIAVAAGRAFTFTYTDTSEALEAAGAEVVPFDPRTDPALPDRVHGLIAGGGFPEVYATELATNRPLLDDVRSRVSAGLPTWAECGGLLWLCRTLDGHAMAGVIEADGHLSDKLTLGYRTATANRDTPAGRRGSVLRGHEFHYSKLDPPGDALTLSSRWATRPEGWATPTLLATYLHHHPGGDPAAVEQFVTACRLGKYGSGHLSY